MTNILIKILLVFLMSCKVCSVTFIFNLYLLVLLALYPFLVHAVSRIQQGREREPGVTLHSLDPNSLINQAELFTQLLEQSAEVSYLRGKENNLFF